MTLITKNSYVDNWYSEIKGTVEVGWFGKKCFIEWLTGKIVKDDGVPQNCQAFKMGVKIARGDI